MQRVDVLQQSFAIEVCSGAERAAKGGAILEWSVQMRATRKQGNELGYD